VSPGEVLAARLVNRMNKMASYGVAFRIERFSNGSWQLDPSSPKGPWPKKLGRLEPGSAGACFYFRIPAQQPQGKYRIVTFVRVDGKKTSRNSEWRIRTLSRTRAAASHRRNPGSFCTRKNPEEIRAGVFGPAIAGIAAIAKSSRLLPSSTAYARLINRGPNRATYGPNFRIEHYENGEWMLDPASPQGPWPKVLYGLGIGQAGRCFRWAVPASAHQGLFRFVFVVNVAGDRSRRIVEFRIA
jgi:hypothetical protein